MEVPYMRERVEEEDEEENGVNLQTNRKSKSLVHQYISNTSSDASVLTTELSNSSLEYSSTASSMEDYYTNSNSNIVNTINNITNGEKPKINGVRSVKNEEEAVEALSEADEKASFDETNKRENYSNASHQNQDSNGTAARQKGVGVIEYSLSENNEGDKETDIGSNTDVGFRDVGSFLDESSSRVNVASSEIYDTEKTVREIVYDTENNVREIVYDTENNVREIVVWNDQGKVVETSHSEDIEPVIEEYDVESVVKNQKTHDIICPNCQHCITDRVILKRRKRKTPEPDSPEIQLPHDKPPDHLEAISCFSCFRIFIPKGDGFLSWIIKPKPTVPLHPGDTLPDDPAEVPSNVDREKRFPLWIVTCCQPDHEKPVGTATEPSKKSPLTPEQPEAGTGDQERKDDLHSSPVHEGQAPPKSLSPISPDPAGLNTQNQETNNSQSQSQDAGTDLQPGQDTHVNSEGGFPLWFLTCCHGKDSKLPVKSDETVPSTHETEPKPENGTEVSHPRELSSTSNDAESVPPTSRPPLITQPSAAPPLPGPKDPKIRHDDAESIPPTSKPPLITQPSPPLPGSKDPNIRHDDAESVPPTSKPPLITQPSPPLPDSKDPNIPHDDAESVPPTLITQPSPPLLGPKDSQIPHDEGHRLDISREHRPPSPVSQPNDGPATDIEASLLPSPREGRRTGVSGLDIIKAIVYGGLVECITSLSVITSAAGGEATTLNIVALGLANVVGGLILLLHDLRVLIHEHTADRYENQLGRRDHFPLHAVVAVISYLVFGLLSPVIYGFTFRKSDNKDYKLATLAAASLFCITLLSIGKAYVRRLSSKAYIQTILYYLSVGFMVSGVGYVAGHLINLLLKKLGVFDSSAPVAMPGLETGFVNGAWSSY